MSWMEGVLISFISGSLLISIAYIVMGIAGIGVVGALDVAPALLLTDVRLPRTSGPGLARIMRKKNPDLGVVYMTGYLGALGSRESSELADNVVLQKPFKRSALVRAIHRALKRCNTTNSHQ